MIVQCKCGWQGDRQGLVKAACPKCSAVFEGWPRETITWNPRMHHPGIGVVPAHITAPPPKLSDAIVAVYQNALVANHHARRSEDMAAAERFTGVLNTLEAAYPTEVKAFVDSM